MPAPRLGLATKVSYGLGSVAQGVGSVALSTAVINYYLVSVVGLRPAVVGLVIMVSLIIDAVLDPLIGRWSDTFRSRLGAATPVHVRLDDPDRDLHGAALAPPGLDLGRRDADLRLHGAGGAARLRVASTRSPATRWRRSSRPTTTSAPACSAGAGSSASLAACCSALLLNGVFLRRDAANPLGQNNPAGYASFGIVAAVIAVVLHPDLRARRPTATSRSCSRRPQRRQSPARRLARDRQVLSNPSLLAIMASGLVSGDRRRHHREPAQLHELRLLGPDAAGHRLDDGRRRAGVRHRRGRRAACCRARSTRSAR